jgi:ABC-type nitrate/sulfonate/bicarbonate transport system permease component
MEAGAMIARVGSLIGLIAVWWFLSLGASEFGLPSPSAVLDALVELLEDGRLMSALGVTLSSFAVGALLAVLLGVPLGILMGFRPWLGRAVDPYLTALYVMPSAIRPLVLRFGIDEQVRSNIFPFTIPQVAIAVTRAPSAGDARRSRTDVHGGGVSSSEGTHPTRSRSSSALRSAWSRHPAAWSCLIAS